MQSQKFTQTSEIKDTAVIQKLPKRNGKQKFSATSLYIYFKTNNVTSRTLLKLSNAGILTFKR